jgi:hypothetical protein
MARRSSLPQSQGLQVDGCVHFAAVGGPPETLLDEHLAEIARLGVPALRAKWASLFGRSPPKGVGRRLLELAAVYHEQAKIHGGLKPATQRKLLRMARTRPNAETPSVQSNRKAPLSPGSRLVREWHGRSHTVEVTAAGFQYAGRKYRSLSEVARAITGVRWSGPRFFGL